MRKTIFANGEFYHIYNRGTEKRTIFLDEQDYARFKESIVEFNVVEPIGSLFENSFRKKNQLGGSTSKSSWIEYTKEKSKGGICEKEAVLGQFRTKKEYVTFAKNSIQGTIERRGLLDESMLLE